LLDDIYQNSLLGGDYCGVDFRVYNSIKNPAFGRAFCYFDSVFSEIIPT